jgi:hypothetical protein
MGVDLEMSEERSKEKKVDVKMERWIRGECGMSRVVDFDGMLFLRG